MMRIEDCSGINRCQDCGNQAKRDCPHLRCRTCCKSRGFECQTHVKSTWVPASQRQPRRGAVHQIAADQPPHYHYLYGPNPKRRCRQTLVGLEEGDFPGEVSYPAVLRCVRVSSLDNTVEQYAYQTSVSIGGHVFRGILYDHGPELEGTGNCVTGESSSAGTGTGIGIGLLQHPHFGTCGGTTGNADGTASSSYLRPYCAANPQFFQHPKS